VSRPADAFLRPPQHQEEEEEVVEDVDLLVAA